MLPDQNKARINTGYEVLNIFGYTSVKSSKYRASCSLPWLRPDLSPSDQHPISSVFCVLESRQLTAAERGASECVEPPYKALVHPLPPEGPGLLPTPNYTS
ncbi:hypothetical protein DFAR_2480039 [Desulfarculales bacterium]